MIKKVGVIMLLKLEWLARIQCSGFWVEGEGRSPKSMWKQFALKNCLHQYRSLLVPRGEQFILNICQIHSIVAGRSVGWKPVALNSKLGVLLTKQSPAHLSVPLLCKTKQNKPSNSVVFGSVFEGVIMKML